MYVRKNGRYLGINIFEAEDELYFSCRPSLSNILSNILSNTVRSETLFIRPASVQEAGILYFDFSTSTTRFAERGKKNNED